MDIMAYHTGESPLDTPFVSTCSCRLHSYITRDCDSPVTLTNFTLDYLEGHRAKEIDFVICEYRTGD